MPPILNAQGVSKRFGAVPLFEEISFPVSEGDRIGLIGPNGAGKSTLLKVLAGEEDPDTGDVATRKRARIGYIRQESTFADRLTVRDVLEKAVEAAGVPEAEREGRLQETSGRTGFPDMTAEAARLSGGWRKRLAIAEAIVSGPDVLLLDEPTNHLDLAGIAWLEETLKSAPFACVLVSHDRYFLENVATEIVELNKVYADGLLRVKGTYTQFLEGKEQYLEAQSKLQDALKNRVKIETEWLRRGPKARTTKSKARIDSAQDLIGQLKEVNQRVQTSTAGIDFSATDRQTKRLVEFEGVSCTLGEGANARKIVENLDFLITSGMRVGLVGPNGSGKTTLLRLLREEIKPDTGEIKKAAFLKVVYFSQTRELDESVTLRRALAPDSDSVVYQGRVVHVASYATKFLFTSEQLNQPVERLSGGERARVLIAKLMLEPADLLLLDEPTNDLDIATLEILEESLLEYTGALVLVTHDRFMLDRVSTVVLGLDGKGGAERFGDYSQWEQWKGVKIEEAIVPGSSASAAGGGNDKGGKKKLSYLEAREYAGIEALVDKAEERLNAARDVLDDPSVATNAEALTKALHEMEQAQTEADGLYQRWAELTEKAG
ncbi:ABC-F family ATP-binding cassette domain-containing protein [Granulicella tundricola]|uniref:ABC transporter related protein n=1 Tax=Granulicella tundricola (strain ATCC BAA-1859 / DSM 23138 / MP5ACTX9) TaxID=1198114 RepID=E8X589_GRATM|nr:ABC-F family ATP-binding cassette domain-containing protein [Granulicella tundricola]ADW68353.1 ABC transporter related protein [Granulicella tundricola MP5ACTX9]